MRVTDDLLREVKARLGHSRYGATPAAVLASDLRVSTRTVRALVNELIDRGELVGSSSNGSNPGYFLIDRREDLEYGTEHLRSRALSMLRRLGMVKRAAEQRFGPDVLTLFSLDEEEAIA